MLTMRYVQYVAYNFKEMLDDGTDDGKVKRIESTVFKILGFSWCGFCALMQPVGHVFPPGWNASIVQECAFVSKDLHYQSRVYICICISEAGECQRSSSK